MERLVRERTRELSETRLEIVNRLGRAAEYRDNETGMHILRYEQLCQADRPRVRNERIRGRVVLMASPMHDIGKIGIPDTILLKPGPLDPSNGASCRPTAR
jgi:putative two-component system response regulator